MAVKYFRKRLFLCSSCFLCLVALTPGMARGQVGPPPMRVESALVTVPVIVSDAQGRFISGLNPDDFSLLQDGIPVPVPLFLTSEDPIKIALLLDTSRSTTTVLGRIKKAAERFLLQMRPKDLAMVVSLDSDIRVLSPLSSDTRELTAAINRAESGGMGTRIRDALAEIALRRFRSMTGRKAVVLLTDGEDHGSEVAVPTLLNGLTASSTLIYSIFFHVDPRQLMRELVGSSSRLPKPAASRKNASKDPWEQREADAAAFLERVSDSSAGRFYRSDVAELDKAFNQISNELRSQYLLGFYPDKSKLDGEVHSLEVRVTAPDTVVRSRRSYRAVD
jgi:VWFA-related protein